MLDSISFTSANLVTFPLLIVALAIWAIELQRKEFTVPGAAMLRKVQKASHAFRFESWALCMCAALVLVLCMRQKNNGFDVIDKSDMELWQRITSDWPLLMTADSLLSIQSMIRVIMLLSTVLRCGAGALGTSPLVPESASFMLVASICRISLIAMSPFDVYHLDGPLGGAVYVLFELAALPLLMILSLSTLYQGAHALVVVAGGLAFCLAVACHEQFYLADEADVHLDMLFSMALILELPAAISCLVRSCLSSVSESCPSEKQGAAGFAHVLLPVQQGLSLYFLLVGLAPPLETPKALMRAGHPFEFMWFAGAAQVVVYSLAAIVYFASMDNTEVGDDQRSTALYVQV